MVGVSGTYFKDVLFLWLQVMFEATNLEGCYFWDLLRDVEF